MCSSTSSREASSRAAAHKVLSGNAGWQHHSDAMLGMQDRQDSGNREHSPGCCMCSAVRRREASSNAASRKSLHSYKV
jgi:hypothetical protein